MRKTVLKWASALVLVLSLVLCFSALTAAEGHIPCGPDAVARWQGTKLTISGTGATYNKKLSSLLSGCESQVSEVVVEDGITGIGSYFFSGMTAIKTVTLPKGLDSIGYDAFSGCTGLKSIQLPQSLEWIGDDAFSGCASLSSLTIPDGVQSFADCDIIRDCSSLTYLYLGSGITDIAYYDFDGCASLKEISIGRLDSLDAHVFSDAPKLDTVVYRGDCAGLTEDIFAGSEADVALAKKAMWIYEKVSPCAGYRLRGKTLHVSYLSERDRAGTASTGNFSASGLPYFQRSAEKLVFDNGGESFRTIGQNAFAQMSNLKEAELPTSLVTLESGAFSECRALKQVRMPEGLTTIGEQCFLCCSLETVYLPRSVQYLGFCAFGFKSVGDVYYSGSIEESYQIQESPDGGNDGLWYADWYFDKESEPKALRFEQVNTEVYVGDRLDLSLQGCYEDEANENCLSRLTGPVSKWRSLSAGNFYWDVSKKGFARVRSGRVTFLKEGTVTITAVSHRNSELSVSITFHIQAKKETPIRSIGIRSVKRSFPLSKGKAGIALKAVLRPANTTQKGLVWSSSDKDIATVNRKGVVTFRKAGTVRITCRSQENPKIKRTIRLTARDD